MADRLILHGDIQRALIEANEVCERFRFTPDGWVWELHPSGWAKVCMAPRAVDRRAYLWGRLDEKLAAR